MKALLVLFALTLTSSAFAIGEDLSGEGLCAGSRTTAQAVESSSSASTVSVDEQ